MSSSLVPIRSRGAPKRNGVARSSTEVEYHATAYGALKIIWICSLLQELVISFPSTPMLYRDNIGENYLCVNPVLQSRMKHIALESWTITF